MRKWKQGVIALIVSFLGLALMMFGYYAGIMPVAALSLVAMFFSILYGLVLVGVFIFQMIYGLYKEGRTVEGNAVRTVTTTVYECGKCRRQYSDSETCPYCGHPYRRTVKETTEQERVRSARTSMVR